MVAIKQTVLTNVTVEKKYELPYSLMELVLKIKNAVDAANEIDKKNKIKEFRKLNGPNGTLSVGNGRIPARWYDLRIN